jgi:GNAT superfamily N-acetyltransferase
MEQSSRPKHVIIKPTVELRFAEITDISDGLLLPWLDLYQRSFDQREQNLISDLLWMMKHPDESKNGHFLAALDDDGDLAGIALYSGSGRSAWLWYLAVHWNRRGQGIGHALYQEVVRRCLETYPDIRALLMEIGRPDQAESEDKRLEAERRIRFYREIGVRIATNIRYWLDVGDWQPRSLLYLGVHPIQQIDDAEALELLQDVFGEQMEPASHIVLD